MKLHLKVRLWYGGWWAVQYQRGRYTAWGFHCDWSRPLLDLHLHRVIVALGRRPELTPYDHRLRQSCRGFLFDSPTAPVL